MTMVFDDSGLGPGINTAVNDVKNQFWWGRIENQLFLPAMILSSAVDSGNTSYTTVLRPGLLMGKIMTGASAGFWTTWAPTANDGSEVLAGVLLRGQNMNRLGTATSRFSGFIHVAGNLRANKLLIPGNTNFGINGETLELMVRNQVSLNGRWILDDESYGAHGGGWKRYIDLELIDTTGAYQCVESDNNTFFHNSTATGDIAVTLPAIRPGYRFGFFNSSADVADQIVVTSAAGDDIVTHGDSAADSVTVGTGGASGNAMGGCFLEFISYLDNGTTYKWACIPHLTSIADTAATARLLIVT